MNMHQFRSISSAIALSLTSILAGTVGVGLTADSVHAQVRALPDFTELVEQVGPSVVNIRTTEKLSLRGPNGSVTEGMDEDRPHAAAPLPKRSASVLGGSVLALCSPVMVSS
jgi:serine protease Do